MFNQYLVDSQLKYPSEILFETPARLLVKPQPGFIFFPSLMLEFKKIIFYLEMSFEGKSVRLNNFKDVILIILL